MKRLNFIFALIVILSFCTENTYADAAFSNYFKDNTMRFDYFHTGTANEEHFAIDQMVNDGIWAGSKTHLIDHLRLGKYFFEIQNPQTEEVLYSQGFCSVYGEWETTPEAKENWGVYHESMRFPWPIQKVKLVLYKRNDTSQIFEPIWNYTIDPEYRKVNPSIIKNNYKVYPIVENGDSHNKVDIVVLSEGYTKNEMEKFHKDAENYARTLLNTEPFKSRKNDFNIRAVEVPSPNSGLNHPQQDIYNRSALSVSYGAFGSQRYALGYDNKKIRDAASAVPYEFTAILMNDSIYGGGGIYKLYITAAADNAFNEYLFVHEFGHHFAALADEYYTSATAYEMGSNLVEPYELNVTTYTDKDKVKWGKLISEDISLPTPWGKAEFDKHSIAVQKERTKLRDSKASENIMEKLFMDQREWEESYLGKIKYANKVGLYEGAMYHAKGMYRSEPNCIMYSRTNHFCFACQRAINLVIDHYTK